VLLDFGGGYGAFDIEKNLMKLGRALLSVDITQKPQIEESSE
jgi:hypothetical protein